MYLCNRLAFAWNVINSLLMYMYGIKESVHLSLKLQFLIVEIGHVWVLFCSQPIRFNLLCTL